MKHTYLPLLIVLLLLPAIAVTDPIDKVADLIKQGNIHELSKMFAENVEITIRDEENIYSKTQAELILNKFFSENKPRTVTLLHRINSNTNYRFGVLIVNTDKAAFRIAITLKQADGNFTLIEMRIENEKVR